MKIKKGIFLYIAILAIFICIWIFKKQDMLSETILHSDVVSFLLVVAIYLASHIFRMLRLVLLSLNQRGSVIPLVAAHALTAFPSSLLMFKMGELLRLTSFVFALGEKRNAFSIWFIERMGDVSAITIFILGLYILDIDVPSAMRSIFVIFVVISLVALLGIFAITKIFTFLNSYLVLESYSQRGLTLLKISHFFREVESDIYAALKGRFIGFILVTLIIWILEFFALSLFLKIILSYSVTFPDLFVSGLIGSLFASETTAANFGLYQSVGLILISLASILLVLPYSIKNFKS
jgi:hypothetical protein